MLMEFPGISPGARLDITTGTLYQQRDCLLKCRPRPTDFRSSTFEEPLAFRGQKQYLFIMENQFYRREKKPPVWQGFKSGILGNRKFMVFLAVVVPLILFILFNPKGVLKRIGLEDQKKQTELRIDSLRTEQSDLEQKSKALDNDQKAIEKTARERYGMVKEGETVYHVQRKRQ